MGIAHAFEFNVWIKCNVHCEYFLLEKLNVLFLCTIYCSVKFQKYSIKHTVLFMLHKLNVLLIETIEYRPEIGEWFLELAGIRPAAKKMWERRKIKKEAFESAATHVIWLLQPTIYRSSSGWYTQSAMFKLKKVLKIFIDGFHVGQFAYGGFHLYLFPFDFPFNYIAN